MRLKKQIEEKYKQEVLALELLWKNYGNKESGTFISSKRTISESAREVMKALDKPFSVNEIADGLRDLGQEVSKPQLSNLLNRLARSEEIEIVENGRGRMPNSYRLKDHDPTNELDF
ncbi:MAG: hypothetical protein KF681_00065 [Bdellovibrionaceae bacterium]|nr:hypothetical protein [Pseudobdellovibrionaceae bacterium]